jgi:probable rRNA maturation factor
MTAKSNESIEFYFEHKALTLTDRYRLKEFIITIFKKEKVRVASLLFVFCDDLRVLEMNQEFLGHNYYTDILTFNLAAATRIVQGEIYISLDRVKDNARALNQYCYVELHRVIFHGVLHLCGYRDKSPQEKREMRAKENSYLSAYFKRCFT